MNRETKIAAAEALEWAWTQYRQMGVLNDAVELRAAALRAEAVRCQLCNSPALCSEYGNACTFPQSAGDVREPVAYLYQHDETGMTSLVLAPNRWKDMPRYQEIPLYTAHVESERVRELEALLRDWIECKRDKLELFDETTAALAKGE